ncbi:MAG: dihydrofolate reductase [Vulcanimicrobiota bacterium]
MTISLIAALGENREIGKDNQLLWRLPDDLARFKSLTAGKPLVMGRKTYQSIGRPLPGRRMIVVTRQPDFEAPGCEVVSDPEAAVALCHGTPEVMIGGGEAIYAYFLPRADRQYLTYVEGGFEADAFYPEFDRDEWKETARVPHPRDERHAYDSVFVTLERRD